MQRQRLPASAARISVAHRGGVLRQQGLRGHQDARRAVAALGGAEIGERGLQRVELVALLQALDGLDRPPLHLGGERQAGEHRLAVDQHGAGAAFAELAAVLRAGQAELLAQHLEQGVVDRERRPSGSRR